MSLALYSHGPQARAYDHSATALAECCNQFDVTSVKVDNTCYLTAEHIAGQVARARSAWE